jgi:hypothetical protein
MEWFKSKRGWVTTAIAFFTLIAEYVFRPWELAHTAISIYETIRDNFHYLKAWIAPALFLLALFFFERDRRKTKSYDLTTLKGRTLKLRDEIQAFFNEVPPPGPQLKGESKDDHLKRTRVGWSRRIDHLANGYAWRFYDRVLTINYQFGERGLFDAELQNAVKRPNFDEECYTETLAGLTRLSEHPEEATGVSTISASGGMSFKDYQEGRNRGVF